MSVKRYKPTSPARRYFEVLSSEGLNVYDILNHPSLVIAADAVKAIETRVLAAGTEAKAS